MTNEKKKQSLLERSINNRYIDDGKIPNDDVMLIVNGKKVGSLGNFIALSGKQKSRKTAFLGAIMGSAITGKEILNINCDLPELKNELLHIDTEQSEYDYKMSLDRMKRLAGIKKMTNKIPFHSFRFRDWTSKDIKDFINEYLVIYAKTGVVVIDGIVDMVTDFNSIDECKKIVDWLKVITEQHGVLVICVIHRSKSANFSLGHLGSMIDRFAQASLEVLLGNPGEKTVNKSVSTMQPEYMRSDQEFEPITITYDHGKQTWRQCDWNVKEEKA